MSRSARVPLEELRPYVLDAPHPRYMRPEQLPVAPPRLDWAAVFGKGAPVEIEVGFGKGQFLVASAQARPDANFLGVEIERKYTLATAGRLARHGLRNARVVCTDARWFFAAYVSDRSVRAVHVYFPDPWWKKRHKKRLLFTELFAAEVARILEPSGVLHFATDVEEYYTATLELVHGRGELRELPWPADEEGIQTNFERKYRAEGRPIHRMRFVLAAHP